MLQDDKRYALERWKSAFGHYDGLKMAIEHAVVRRELTSANRYDLRPLAFLRDNTSPADVIEPKENVIGAEIRYGFDRDNRVIWEENSYGDVFYHYEERWIETINFIEYGPYSPLPLSLTIYFLENERFVRSVSFLLSGVQFPPPDFDYSPEGVLIWLERQTEQVYRHETYIYEDDRLVKIEKWSNSASRLHEDNRAEEHILYTDNGEIERIELYERGERNRVLYQRALPGQTHEALRSAVRDILLFAIPSSLAVGSIAEEVALVTLHWSSSDIFQVVPYMSYVSLQRRLELAKALDYEAIWYSYEKYVPMKLSAEGEGKCRVLERENADKEDWYGARDLFREVAAQLTKTYPSWTRGVLHVPEDFIVYVIEDEYGLDDLEEALLASVSEAQIKEWQAKGLLPDDISGIKQ